jgi:SagB-type dehydrogenase family enzyme
LELSTLLGLTWGTQKWMQVREDLAFRLKTSPSGGACHSLEVYVAAARVKGLDPGLYWYSPDEHALAPLNRAWEPSRWPDALGGQEWTANASAVFLVTSVFSRVQWKYKSARAYRTVLLEAGHFCQTFCLVATWLKLAPFCTAAFADSRIERLLRVDGLSESMLYAMGVGTRPAGATSAPWPHARSGPIVTEPAHRGPTILRRNKKGTRRSERT